MRNLEENLRHTADGASPTCGHKRRWVGSSRRTKMKTLEVSSSHTKNQVEKLQKCSCYEHKTASEAKGLNHCQWFKSFMLKSFLQELSSDYGDFPHNTEVSGWASERCWEDASSCMRSFVCPWKEKTKQRSEIYKKNKLICNIMSHLTAHRGLENDGNFSSYDLVC